ncbi:amidohydrolase family protein [Streptomyces sp. NPDC056160]|uniref:amidohydrolase family protein n=1 Tax=Streptomyces sp. NPDC056160 TaxID=3345731 RepID=UPI0035E00ABC
MAVDGGVEVVRSGHRRGERHLGHPRHRPSDGLDPGRVDAHPQVRPGPVPQGLRCDLRVDVGHTTGEQRVQPSRRAARGEAGRGREVGEVGEGSPGVSGQGREQLLVLGARPRGLLTHHRLFGERYVAAPEGRLLLRSQGPGEGGPVVPPSADELTEDHRHLEVEHGGGAGKPAAEQIVALLLRPGAHRAGDLGPGGAQGDPAGRCGERPLDDPAYDEVLATAAALRRPVFIHPQIPPKAVREASYSGFGPALDLGLATFGWGWHVEAGVAALRLVLRGTFDRHPDLQIVLGHRGELLLFWLDRADRLSDLAPRLQRRVCEYFATNIHVATSGILTPRLLRHALDHTSADRIVLSGDYPFHRIEAAAVADLLHTLPEEDQHKIAHANAEKLYRLAPAPSVSDLQRAGTRQR